MDLNFDFYVAEPIDDVSLEEAFAAISKLPSPSRTVEVQGRTFRLSQLKDDGKGWSGDFVRIRMNNLPSIANLDSDALEDIPLNDDQGIGECTSFYYDTALNVVSLQRNRMCIGPSLISPVLRNMSKLDKAWSLDPVIREDAYDKVMRASELNTLTINFARVKNPQLVASGPSGNTSIVDLLKSGTVPVVRLELGTGRDKSALGAVTKSFKDAIKKLFRMNDTEADGGMTVEKIEVNGVDENGDWLDIKLFRYQMSHTIPLASQAEKRKIPYVTRRTGAKESFDKNRAAIRHLISARHEPQ